LFPTASKLYVCRNSHKPFVRYRASNYYHHHRYYYYYCYYYYYYNYHYHYCVDCDQGTPGQMTWLEDPPPWLRPA